MQQSDTLNLVITVLVATGLLTAVSETIRWWLSGRGRQKIDTAKVVQGMALDLLQPLHAELAQAQSQVAAVRRDLATLDHELQSVLGWAIIARALLDSNHIDYPTPPEALRRTR